MRRDVGGIESVPGGIPIRIVRFARSTQDVLTCAGSGVPSIVCDVQPMHLAGL